MRKFLRTPEVWVIIALTLASVGVRFWRLGFPAEIVFDETYYAVWGQNYFQGQSFFDVHPPLGKLLIGLGSWLLGSNPEAATGALGWRFAVALFGVFIVPLTYFIAKKFFSEPKIQTPVSKIRITDDPNPRRIALLAGLFVLIDGLLLVQTRTALLDSFLVVFVLASYGCFFLYRDAKTARDARAAFLLMGVCSGLALATKWTGLAPLGVLGFWWLAHYDRLPRLSGWITLLGFILIPTSIYLLSFIWNVRTTDFMSYLIDWHKQTWNFHHTLTATHPYQSRWWTWLYLARPVWYYYKETDGIVTGILALGNPILWWASLPALFASLITILRRRTPELVLPLMAFLAAYLPWGVIGRTQFQYYLVGGVPFLLIILAYWIDRWLDHWALRRFAILIILLAILVFIFFWPILIGQPISATYYRLHVWFQSWI